jgi:hypothetical protein
MHNFGQVQGERVLLLLERHVIRDILFVFAEQCFLHYDICRFLFKFTGQDQEINLLGDGTEKPEFGEWAWISPEQVIDLVSICDYDDIFKFLVLL